NQGRSVRSVSSGLSIRSSFLAKRGQTISRGSAGGGHPILVCNEGELASGRAGHRDTAARTPGISGSTTAGASMAASLSGPALRIYAKRRGSKTAPQNVFVAPNAASFDRLFAPWE